MTRKIEEKMEGIILARFGTLTPGPQQSSMTTLRAISKAFRVSEASVARICTLAR